MKKALNIIGIIIVTAVCCLAGWCSTHMPEHSCPVPTIEYVQKYMLDRGYYNGKVDGKDGPLTHKGWNEMSEDDAYSTFNQYGIENMKQAKGE